MQEEFSNKLVLNNQFIIRLQGLKYIFAYIDLDWWKATVLFEVSGRLKK